MIVLQVDEPTTDATLLDDIIQSVEPEAGFKGKRFAPSSFPFHFKIKDSVIIIDADS